MRIIFDQGTPHPLRRSLPDHDVSTVYELGWSTLSNGELLSVVEESGFEVLVATDTNLKHQQGLTDRRFGIIVLLSTRWPRIKRVIPSVVAAITGATPGSYAEVKIPV